MKPKILLHSCCAPCLTSVYEQLSPTYDVVVFWYNPNIWPQAEHDKRLSELIRYCKEVGIDLLIGDYDYEEENQYWRSLIKGLEKEPEKGLPAVPGAQRLQAGKRCRVCYRMRLEATAFTAIELSCCHHHPHNTRDDAQGQSSSPIYQYFGTELSVSPHKDAKMLNEIGEEIESTINKNCHSCESRNLGIKNYWIPDQVRNNKHRLKYLSADFKKAGGFKRSTELSKEHDLYRQNYCGCPFSANPLTKVQNTQKYK